MRSVLILSLGLFLASNVSAKSFREATVAGVKVLAEDIQSVRLESVAILKKKGEKSKIIKSSCVSGEGQVSKLYVGTICEVHLPTGEIILLDIKK